MKMKSFSFTLVRFLIFESLHSVEHRERRVGEIVERDQEVQTLRYKINKSWGLMCTAQ